MNVVPKALVGAHGWGKALDLVGQSIQTDLAVGELDVPVVVFPGDGVLEPILVVAFLEVLTRMGPTRLGSAASGVRDHHGLVCEIGELQR